MRGEEDFNFVRRDVKRMREQKSLILGSLKEIHGKFKSDCPAVKVVSHSLF
jgi:uncharacterized ferredoxin-like protein